MILPSDTCLPEYGQIAVAFGVIKPNGLLTPFNRRIGHDCHWQM
jgi:hypothetical protein